MGRTVDARVDLVMRRITLSPRVLMESKIRLSFGVSFEAETNVAPRGVCQGL